MAKSEETAPFIIKQLEEALEERQTPDRRKGDIPFEGDIAQDRRKSDRRSSSQASH
ncbi:hypothetical protein [Agarilytica rhodophyticola]|uniref:hypothetical protein n=1 Tax=Agarilytica rhodophyticola TaxID=1737490 RepID=UPI00131590ED|nr:hypothetical protein [Agarilytica rhodophyticola]